MITNILIDILAKEFNGFSFYNKNYNVSLGEALIGQLTYDVYNITFFSKNKKHYQQLKLIFNPTRLNITYIKQICDYYKHLLNPKYKHNEDFNNVLDDFLK